VFCVPGKPENHKRSHEHKLSRLYNPDSGELLIDGKKANEYRLAVVLIGKHWLRIPRPVCE